MDGSNCGEITDVEDQEVKTHNTEDKPQMKSMRAYKLLLSN